MEYAKSQYKVNFFSSPYVTSNELQLSKEYTGSHVHGYIHKYFLDLEF